ncbi:MAG: DUF4294 domain-containing protein [Bacteroidales bacterium]|nr:DUF4294 domain-containing protein [Bacteroidales bacterium]
MRKALFILLSLLAATPALLAQWPVKGGYLMYYEVEENGDTVFRDVIDPVWVFPRNRRGRRKGNDWRKKYKLVYNFNRVYPYALAGRKMIRQVDSTLAADVSKRSQRNRYIDDVEKELFRLFEKDIRNMTISQGVVLMRLIDRECGRCPYDLIKTYESGFVAGFWQVVAKLFSQDLKARYDPKGKDADIEQLVQIWEAGQWDAFYSSIFMEKPIRYTVERDHLESSVKPLKKK